MRRLLHISDVHFGPRHLAEVSGGVTDFVRREKLDLVVLSGDHTQRAKPRQFLQAREFVRGLSIPYLAVPGNHDVPLYRVWERVFCPFRAYRRCFEEELEPFFEDDELVVAGINSAHGWTLTNGRIRARRLEELGRRLEATAADACRVVVVHHPLVSAPVFTVGKTLLGARRALAALDAAGVDLVLSGHEHVSWEGHSGDMLMVHSGTTTTDRGRGSEKGRNTANLIEIERHEIRVQRLMWDGAEGALEAEGEPHCEKRRSRSIETR